MANLKLPTWGLVDRSWEEVLYSQLSWAGVSQLQHTTQLGPNIIHQDQGTMGQVVNANN